MELDGLPFQDLPNHLARAVVELDLLFDHGARFGSRFAFDLQFSPYLGGDAVLAAAVAAFGPRGGGTAWVILVAASLPAALAAYLRATHHSAGAILVAVLVSLYLSTDVFFTMGMHHYRLAVALVVLALAAWEVWLRGGSAAAWCGWAALLVAAYLVHLSALVFCTVGAAVVAVVAMGMRETTWRRAVIGAVPVAALLGWHAAAARGLPSGAADWRPLTKLTRPVRPFVRWEWLADGALLALFVVVCALLLRGSSSRGRDRRFVTAVALAGAFLLTYLGLPYAQGTAAAVDVRAVPLVAVFGLVAALTAAGGRAARGRVTIAAALLAAANLAVLARHLLPQNAVMSECRAVAARVPTGARVLPVASSATAFHHAGAFATVYGGAYTPYLFTSEITPYFRDLARPAPLVDASWYRDGKTTTAAERAVVAASFDYVFVLEPFDAERLGVPLEPVTRSGAAALLAIDCGGGCRYR